MAASEEERLREALRAIATMDLAPGEEKRIARVALGLEPDLVCQPFFKHEPSGDKA